MFKVGFRERQLTKPVCAGIVLLLALAVMSSSAQEQELVPKTAQAAAPEPQTKPNKAAQKQQSFSEFWFAKVSQKAQTLAQGSYDASAVALPSELSDLTYNQYRGIRYNPEEALWRGDSDFELQLFHPGYLFKNSVAVNVVDEYLVVRSLGFDSGKFLYEREASDLAALSALDVGHSGFRIHFPVNASDYKDELIAFQGASYFRLVGPGQVYGLSARGLAIDTGEFSGEEFPYFTEFWLKKPAKGASKIEFIALLDSPSLTGAYHFSLAVGKSSFVDVRAKLFMRDSVKKLGIAPLTSMFFFGEAKQQYFDDFRPEVHDSDGVQILTGGGEWIWRPVRNPKNLQITSSLINDLGGFGLFQRDREFAHYQDTEANYHRRPSYWVEPLGQWQKGRVELVEIPTGDETNDNIVAYWVPEEIPGPGESVEFKYRLTSVGALPAGHNLAYVASTRIGSPEIPGSVPPAPKQHRLFVVDFQGAEIEALHSSQPLVANIEANGGEVKGLRVNKLSDTGQWRVTFTLIPKGDQPVDMRMHLALRNTRISEVWNYLWSNDRVN